MTDFNTFANSLVNITNENKKGKIIRIVEQEKKKLLEKVDSLEGFCKYIASQIEYELKKTDSSLLVYYIDLNTLTDEIVDHAILIVEYFYNGQKEQLLIDPTFIQFTEQKNRKLTGYAEWPGNKLSPILVSQLLDTGVIEITEEIFNEYLNSFLQEKTYFSLEKYLIQNSVRIR